MTPLMKKLFVVAFSLLLGAILLTNIDLVNASNGAHVDSFNPGKVGISGTQAVATCSSLATVTNTDDSGAGSLRDAMTSVCAGGTITFDPALTSGGPATVTLLTTLPDISSNVTISGPGSTLLTVRRSAAAGISDFRILTIRIGVTANISGLTVTNGKTADGAASPTSASSGLGGGGIANFGTLSLLDVVVTANKTGRGGDSAIDPGDGGYGGGIYNSGALTMTGCVVTGNIAGKGGDGGNFIGGYGGRGGGIGSEGGSIILTNVIVSNNFAGDSGVTNFTNAGGYGGGIYSQSVATITNCTISNNSSGNGAHDNGVGGGIANASTMSVVGSTISGNTSNSGGAGIASFSTLTVMNSTISGNNGAKGDGFEANAGTLTNCTITGNSGRGVYSGAPSVNIGNTIIAGNGGGDTYGTMTSLGHNLIGFQVLNATTGQDNFRKPGDQTGTPAAPLNPQLTPLGNYGGPTQTQLLLPSSPAINAGDNALAKDLNNNVLSTDQRGTGYPRIVDTTVDIGAVEFSSVNYIISAMEGTPQSAVVNSAFAMQLKAKVTADGVNQGGASVTFVAPSSGASGTFAGSGTSVTVVTDSNGVATVPVFTANGTAGGPYNVTASLNGDGPTATFSLNNLRGQAQVNLGNITQTYDGTPRSITVTTSPPGLNVVVTYAGSTTTPTNVGSYPITATVNDAGYNGMATGTLTVNKANQTITFGPLPAKTFGDPNFTVSATSSSNLSVSLAASGQCTISSNTVHITGAGSCTITATQAGNSNINPATNVSQIFNIAPATATVTLGNLSQTYSGFTKSPTVTTNPAGLSVTITYSQNGSPIPSPINSGAYNVTATINNPNYQGSATDVLVITKATPSIFWNNPQSIYIGTPLTSAQLNATSNTQGTFVYNLPTGTVLPLGTTQLSVDFTPTDTANYNNATKTVQLTVVVPPPPAFTFSSASYGVNEASGNVPILVMRTGDAAPAVSVDYATSDSAGLAACNTFSGTASSRCDYANTLGTLRFAAGETTKTVFVPIVNDSYAEGVERFNIRLSNPSSGASLGTTPIATVTIADNDAVTSMPNPITDPQFFIRQQYIDFLGREPDPVGWQAWQNILNNCQPTDQSCDRVSVSAGFFRSPEFQDRGYFVYRFYPVALGRAPHYSEFIPDMAKLSGFLTEEEKEANKVAFVQEFMGRPEFANRYGPATDPAIFVDGLLQTCGLPNHPLRGAWISLLTNGQATRAQVLRALTESKEVYDKFYNESFVVMQYFGYLRRDPDILYLEWIKTMNSTGGDYRAMINGFMGSSEYFLRFGP